MPDARILTEADLPAFIALRQMALTESPWAFGSTPEDDVGSDIEHMTKSMAKDEFKIIGVDHPEDASRLVAITGIYRVWRKKRQHRASIWGVYCDVNHRGNGYGKATVQAAIDLAKSWPGIELIDLGVGARSDAAHNVYLSLGFETWGLHPDALRENGEPIGEYQMVLRL